MARCHTMSFDKYILGMRYKKVQGLGDKLPLMKQQIDWRPFVPIVRSVFHDGEEQGGRPHTDEIVIVRCLLLQSWYGLSDPELEFQVNDRLSFQNFLDFPERAPDFTTIWKIRDRLKKRGADKRLWAELQRQLVAKRYIIRRGVIQDASFIEADPGKKRRQKEKKAKKEGEKVDYTKKQDAHIDHDASFAVKNGQVHYGYKRHIKLDVNYQFIRDYSITPANVHDGDVDLVCLGDKKAYRDKGYFGKRIKSLCVEDKTMLRGRRGHPLTSAEKRRNSAIGRLRAPGERAFSVMKCVFHNSATRVKNLARVSIQQMFIFFAYNLYQLVTLRKKALA